MTSVVSVDNFPNQDIRVSLPDGSFVNIGLKYSYNKYSSRGDWFMTLYDGEGNKVCSGRRIKQGMPILTGGLLRDNGNFFAVPAKSDVTEIGIEPWGITHSLIYVDEL